MNKEVKDKWVSALKSGKYKQTRHYLKDECGYCCLGVLTDLYLNEHNLDWEKEGKILPVFKFPGHDDYNLSKEVMEWADLDSCDPALTSYSEYDEGHANISLLNDDYELSFDALAELIEKQL